MTNEVCVQRDQLCAELQQTRSSYDIQAKSKLHRGQRGFFRDGGTYTLSVLSNGGYEDDEDDNGALYHFPQSHQPSHDENDVAAAENCLRGGVPIFYIKRVEAGPARYRIHYPAWITAIEHDSKLMLIEFSPVFRPLAVASPQDAFVLKEKKAHYGVTVAQRAGQARFRMACIQRYGLRGALCDTTEEAMLIACRIYPFAEQGSDEARNGLILSANHHLLFDRGLIQFSDSGELLVREDISRGRFLLFGIAHPSLLHLPNLPASEALHAARTEAHKQNRYKNIPQE